MTDKMRVLVVDDSRVVRKAFSRILGADYDLVEAENGEDAWELLVDDDEICAVFSDLNMPHLDGRGLLERIRTAEDEEIKILPVILVTAADDDDDQTKSALTAGATDYILKPFDSVFLQSKAKAYVKPRDKAIDDNKLATLDPLTRLANRTYFLERGDQEMSAANRRKAELSLLLVAIDDFKKLSEEVDNKLVKGLLRKFGTYMSSEVRLEDTVARIDKYRFAILLSDTNLQHAIEMAERLRQKVLKKTIRHKTKTFKLTTSIGISSLPPDIKRTFDMLMMEADRHLREVQEAGGNAILPTQIASATTAFQDDTSVGSLDEAVAMLARRGKKINKEQADYVIKHLLPLLEYCDDLLDLGLAAKLKSVKNRYNN